MAGVELKTTTTTNLNAAKAGVEVDVQPIKTNVTQNLGLKGTDSLPGVEAKGLNTDGIAVVDPSMVNKMDLSSIGSGEKAVAQMGDKVITLTQKEFDGLSLKEQNEYTRSEVNGVVSYN